MAAAPEMLHLPHAVIGQAKQIDLYPSKRKAPGSDKSSTLTCTP